MSLKIHLPFFEGIRQDIGVVYHRTGHRKAFLYAFEKLGITDPPPYSYDEKQYMEDVLKYLMPAIAKFGLIASPGLYGPPAVYNTYSLKSQLNSRMESAYGGIIIKSQTKLSHVLIFDKDQAIRTFGPKLYSVYDQLSLFGMPKSDFVRLFADKSFRKVVQTYEEDPKTRFSSEVALALTKKIEFNSWVKSGIIKGLVYTGSNDGKCLIVYNHDLLIPKAFARADDSKLLSRWISFRELKDYKKDYETMRNNKIEIQKKHQTVYDMNDPQIIRARKLVRAIENNDSETILEMLQSNYISPFAYWFGQPFYFTMIDKMDDKELFDYIHQNYNFNPNLKEKTTGKTPLQIAMEKDHPETFQSLLKVRHVSLNIYDNLGWPILQNSILLAAKNPKKYLKYFKWIIEDRRVNVNYPTKDKKSPLDVLKEIQNNLGNDRQAMKEMERMLIEKGAK
jgi:hypothetical protein